MTRPLRGPSRPTSALAESAAINPAIRSRRTTAWMTAERVNPRISGQRICHAMFPAIARARPIGSRMFTIAPHLLRTPTARDYTPLG